MASRLQDVIMRGTAATRPAANLVAPGTLYYSTDTITTDRSDGTTWQTYADAGGSSGSIINRIEMLSTGNPDFNEDNFQIVGFPTQPVQSAVLTTAQKTRQIGIVVDGSGVALTTGVKGYKTFPVAGTITGVRLLADQSGSIVIDIWKDTYANYPPTVADTITASAKPTITTATKSEDTTLTGWTTAVAAGDVFGFNIDSITTITRIVLELTIVIT